MEHNSSFNEQLGEENLFDVTKYVEKQKENNEIDLGLFVELAEENKSKYNQTPVNTFLKLKNSVFVNGFFSLDDEGEVDTNRFLKVSSELAKFTDKIFDKLTSILLNNMQAKFEGFSEVLKV